MKLTDALTDISAIPSIPEKDIGNGLTLMVGLFRKTANEELNLGVDFWSLV